MTAAAAGGGAPVVEYRPQDRLLVIGYLEGRTYGAADVAAHENIPRIADACRRLHYGARFGNDFDMFDIQRRYLADRHGPRLPDARPATTICCRSCAAEKALAVRAEGTVPCNNDLLAANLIDDGERIWLIDYELLRQQRCLLRARQHRGRGAADRRRLDELVTAYYGRPRRSKTARAWLLGGLVGSTAGRCGARSRTARARSTSTSGPGPWSASSGAARGFTAASSRTCSRTSQRDD